MESGQGGRGGQKRPKMGGRPLYTVPNLRQKWLTEWGPMAHILHAGGPWKLESPRRHQETGVNAEARQANKVPGGRWGPRVVGVG